MSHASCLNSKTYIEIGCDPWQKVHNLVVIICYLSKLQKEAPNFSKNASKLFYKGDWLSKKGANHVKIVLNNKVPMSLTWVWSFG
jgi:hypothetical protein